MEVEYGMSWLSFPLGFIEVLSSWWGGVSENEEVLLF